MCVVVSWRVFDQSILSSTVDSYQRAMSVSLDVDVDEVSSGLSCVPSSRCPCVDRACARSGYSHSTAVDFTGCHTNGVVLSGDQVSEVVLLCLTLLSLPLDPSFEATIGYVAVSVLCTPL